MSFLMVFLDGFGLGKREDNPVYAAHTPHIDSLLGGHLLWGRPQLSTQYVKLAALDASLGVAGIPQSATGQTTLWTGINAAQVLGYHLNAYPNEPLQQVIAEHSIFKQLADRGKQVTFANAFTTAFEQLVAEGKRKLTASTLCALAGGVKLRKFPELVKGEAVYQDMTNAVFRELEGKEVPLITPFQAGQNLARLALNYDFTLYEFFQTDWRGHKQNWEEAVEIIEQIDEMIGGILAVQDKTDQEFICLITSDHGNIEDFAVRGHTLNPVPALLWSNKTIPTPSWSRLEEVTPTIVNYLLAK